MKVSLVIMAAGLGSRYGGSKQVDGIGPHNEILMEYSIYDALRAGFSKVVFIIKPEMEEMMRRLCGDYLARKTAVEVTPVEVAYVFQDFTSVPDFYRIPPERTKPFGTVHALLCAADVVHEPFCVINADDFYGADAFRKMYDYLSQAEDDDKFRYCMVGYQVENTLTENGTVSRGVCTEDEHGLLAHIIERTSIHRDADGVIRYDADGDAPAGEIAPGTPVSLNLWGFTPSFLPSLDEGLRTFFAEKLPENPMKGEYYLPFAVDALIKAGKATAKVLKTSARWYGVTYREDLASVQESVAAMHAAGIYPPVLFE